jgi:hypothetical protein
MFGAMSKSFERIKKPEFFLPLELNFIRRLHLVSIRKNVSIQLLPVGCHPERSEGSNNLEILRLSDTLCQDPIYSRTG